MNEDRSERLVWTLNTQALDRLREERRQQPDAGWEFYAIPLVAVDSSGWRYETAVGEQDGKLVIGYIRVEPVLAYLGGGTVPPGGIATANLRAIHTPDILAAAAAFEEWSRATSDEELEAEWRAVAKLARSAEGKAVLGAEDAERLAEIASLAPEERPAIFHAGGFLRPHSRERLEERSRPKGKRSRGKGRDHYAWVACAYLLAARVSRTPNVLVADRYRETPGWEHVTPKIVADWVRIAAKEPYRFLADMRPGKAGATPTEALFEWAKAHPDEEIARTFLGKFGTEERNDAE